MSLNISLFGNKENPLSSVVGSVDFEGNFLSKYGSYSSKYDALDPFGKQTFNTIWPFLVAIIGLFGMVIAFGYSSEEVDPKTELPIKGERPLWKKILYFIGWLLVFVMLFGAGYGVYLYFAVYLAQYNQWYSSLPLEAKTTLGMISAMNKLKEQQREMMERLNSVNNPTPTSGPSFQLKF